MESKMGEPKQDEDAMLIEFLSSLMDYTPTIPDELAEHYLMKSGFQCPDVRITRLVAIATQKFIAEIASDAFELCKARQSGMSKEKRDKQQKDKRLVLTIEDLSMALREYGVNVKRPEYFADSTSSAYQVLKMIPGRGVSILRETSLAGKDCPLQLRTKENKRRKYMPSVSEICFSSHAETWTCMGYGSCISILGPCSERDYQKRCLSIDIHL